CSDIRTKPAHDQLYVTHHVQYHIQYGQTEKWTQPGWRIEQRYANKVLIGNWVEEKLQVGFIIYYIFRGDCHASKKTKHFGESAFSTLGIRKWNSLPTTLSTNSSLKSGLAAKLLLSHHGTLPSHYLVTLYDEMYRRQGSSTLPTLCSWHPDRLERMSEKSDHHRYPILSALSSLSFPSFSLPPPTNFGLVESRQACLDQQQPPFSTLSLYRTAYQRHPLSAFCQPRLASVPRDLSSKLHPANLNNKDLEMKQQSSRQVQDNSVSASLFPPLSWV
ncbi:cilia- and flagella-associated protein 107-like, partial [Salvelinus fontinalis]|uniref:cilia- and flagella-associated protein 107-like n=1 Tax=Salvelinus fontinalis TaxID=8038 RepID=UPI0024855565